MKKQKGNAFAKVDFEPTMSLSSRYGRNVIPWARHSSARSVDVLKHMAANLPCTSSSIAEAALASGTSLDIGNYGKSRSTPENPDVANAEHKAFICLLWQQPSPSASRRH
jgi:hypothetical protein